MSLKSNHPLFFYLHRGLSQEGGLVLGAETTGGVAVTSVAAEANYDTMACVGQSSLLARSCTVVSRCLQNILGLIRSWMIWLRFWIMYLSLRSLKHRCCIQGHLDMSGPNPIVPLLHVFVYFFKLCYFFVDTLKFHEGPKMQRCRCCVCADIDRYVVITVLFLKKRLLVVPINTTSNAISSLITGGKKKIFAFSIAM